MSIEIKNHQIISVLKKAKISDGQIKTAINTAEKLLKVPLVTVRSSSAKSEVGSETVIMSGSEPSLVVVPLARVVVIFLIRLL